MIDFKMMGVGLATAVLIDATIVRAVLVPSAMKLLGERNWYLPGWLEWLPRVSGEDAGAVRSVDLHQAQEQEQDQGWHARDDQGSEAAELDGDGDEHLGGATRGTPAGRRQTPP